MQRFERQVRLALTLLLPQMIAHHGWTDFKQIGNFACCQALPLAFDNNTSARLRQMTTFGLEQPTCFGELVCEGQNLLGMTPKSVFSKHQKLS
jgi:hypothetical protein